MCGRYRLAEIDPEAAGTRFAFDERGIDADALGRLNISPTEGILAVTHDGPKVLRWGLIPHWKKTLTDGPLLINARSETATTKAPFAKLMESGERRCLIVTDGWYEWLRPETPKGARTPFVYRVDGGGLFAFAGVWTKARIEGHSIDSAAILTTAANAVCAPVHDRMPVVLPDREAELAWLSADVDATAASELLVSLDGARTAVEPADPTVFKQERDALTLF